jgi:plasmid stabilization system protein ParE
MVARAASGHDRTADALFNHLDSLQAFPYLGAPIEGHPNVRRLLHSPLYVYYWVDANRGSVEILHFWHVSRRQPLT